MSDISQLGELTASEQIPPHEPTREINQSSIQYDQFPTPRITDIEKLISSLQESTEKLTKVINDLQVLIMFAKKEKMDEDIVTTLIEVSRLTLQKAVRISGLESVGIASFPWNLIDHLITIVECCSQLQGSRHDTQSVERLKGNVIFFATQSIENAHKIKEAITYKIALRTRILSMESSEQDNRSVKEMGFQIRARKAMSRLGIRSLLELRASTANELMATRNIGRITVSGIRDRLAELGLHFYGENASPLSTVELEPIELGLETAVYMA